MSSTISDLMWDAARYLNWEPRSNDIVLEGVILRIKELREQDHLGAEAIGRQLLDAFGADSLLVQREFVEFVIGRL